MNPIYKWGIEVEAGWKYNMHRFTPYYVGIHDVNENSCKMNFDALIKESPKALSTLPKLGWNVYSDGCGPNPAELVVYPPTTNRKELAEDLHILYELIEEIDVNCGLHIHASFVHPEIYRRLFSYEYIKFFESEVVKKFEETKTRLKNHWSYSYNPDNINSNQMKKYFDISATSWCDNCGSYHAGKLTGTKSYSLSYQYASLGTLEYRVFPGQPDVERACSYLEFVEDNVKKFMSLPKPAGFANISFIKDQLTLAIDKNKQFWDNPEILKKLATPVHSRVS